MSTYIIVNSHIVECTSHSLQWNVLPMKHLVECTSHETQWNHLVYTKLRPNTPIPHCRQKYIHFLVHVHVVLARCRGSQKDIKPAHAQLVTSI